ncbi:hypothetical protein AGMMS49938_04330 [Fibrobacterales bacterium]|nr:hypothetical protein AGMMS49938_04330 [Fibrobacterales bacterium]
MKKKNAEKDFFEIHGMKLYDTAWEAVGLSPAEADLEEMKFQLAQEVKKRQKTSNVAPVKKKNADFTLDSLFKGLRSLGVSTHEFGKLIASTKVST